jgi:TRAP-type C4-dicarboxylate transport system permease small subunit
MLNLLRKIDQIIERISYYGLIIAIALMLSLSIMTIVFRWFGITFMWIDPLVRHFVFFSAFLGGALAISKNTHIKIDIASKLIEHLKNEKLDKALQVLLALVGVSAVMWMAHASYKFALMELEFGKEAFLGISSGQLVLLIPIGFVLMAYRYFFIIFSTVFSKEKL